MRHHIAESSLPGDEPQSPILPPLRCHNLISSVRLVKHIRSISSSLRRDFRACIPRTSWSCTRSGAEPSTQNSVCCWVRITSEATLSWQTSCTRLPRGSVHRFSLHLPLSHRIAVNLVLGSTNARSVSPSDLSCDFGVRGATPDGLKCVIPWTLAR